MESKYRNIYIVDSRSFWNGFEKTYDPVQDLVLTYDFGLKTQISRLGGEVYYIDHLVDQETLEKNNYIIYRFFKEWHYDRNGDDLFQYKNIPFGFSFRLEFWNDYVSYIRIFLAVSALKKLEVESFYVNTKHDLIIEVLKESNIPYKSTASSDANDFESYYFPINKWMDSKINPSGIRGFLYKVREVVTYIYGTCMPIVDKLFGKRYKYSIFIQEYNPTRKLIQVLREDGDLKIVLTNFSRYSQKLKNLKERLIPISGNIERYIPDAVASMNRFKTQRSHRLILSDGSDITESAYKIIESRLPAERVANALRTLESCIRYLDRNIVDLVVLIANMGHTATIFDLVCKHKNIPSFMIINGILAKNFLDEAKYATIINSYSQSIKENYFHGMDNVVTLGDPRMDMYQSVESKNINRKAPTVTIGTSGFNPMDLNSYVAVEFDFMYDILSSFSQLKSNGEKFHIIIKVRPNGYIQQYQNFVNEFFDDLKVEILSMTPMLEVLRKTDLYISIYSQTLFEASCLGIPVVYYKKDTEVINPPFDNNSELVTIASIEDMVQAFYDFKNHDKRYDGFLDRKVMEKYIGPLDGNNLQRNIDFIYELMEKSKNGVDLC